MASPSSPSPSTKAAARHLLTALKRLDPEALRRCRAQYADVADLADDQVVAAMGLMRCQHVIERELARVVVYDEAHFYTPPEAQKNIDTISRKILDLTTARAGRDRFLRHQKTEPFWHSDRHQCLVTYDLWSAPSPLAIVTGKPGSGKSGFLNDLAADCLRDDQAQVVILDRSNGFDSLVTLSDDGRHWNARVSLFDPCIGSQDHVIGFLPQFVDLLLRRNNGQPLTEDERRTLVTAITDAFHLNGPTITLNTLVDRMDVSTAAGRALSSYLIPGRGQLPATALGSQLTALTIDSGDPCLDLATAACLFQHVIVSLEQPRPWKRMALIIDDAWMFLGDPTLSAMILQLVRQGHAQGLAVVCCTTVLSDFLVTEHGRAILTAAGHRFLFRQHGSDAAALLSLTAAQAQLLQSVTTIRGQYAEVFYQRMPEGYAQVMQVVYDAHFRWVITQNAMEKMRRLNLEKQFRLQGLTPRDALIAAVDACVYETAMNTSSILSAPE
jgi:hypothetical protein